MPTKALIPLPDEPAPAERTCIRIPIPDDSQWKGMFWGALDQLRRWNSYQRDGSHTGRDVAALWSALFDEARSEECHSCPGFYADFGVTPECAYTPDNYVAFDVPGCDACNGGTPSVIGVAVAKQTLQPNANTGWVFRSIVDDSVCGGRICRFSFASVQPNGQALPHVHWEYRNSLGSLIEDDRDTTFFSEVGIEADALCFTCSYHFSVVAVLEGPVLWTAA